MTPTTPTNLEFLAGTARWAVKLLLWTLAAVFILQAAVPAERVPEPNRPLPAHEIGAP